MDQQAKAMPIHPFWVGLLLGLVAGPTVNTVAAFGEEVGWRGLLLRELETLGFWQASALIGVVWQTRGPIRRERRCPCYILGWEDSRENNMTKALFHLYRGGRS
jgi:hypothetical protein